MEFLDVAMVQKISAEESNRVIRLMFVCFSQCFRKNQSDRFLLKICDIRMFAAEKGFKRLV
jgi:hypothetical protein